jgi:hypothetical protein
MFVRSFVDLAIPFSALEGDLLEGADSWVAVMREAEDRGQRLLAEVGFEVDTRRVDKEIEIRVSTPYRSDNRIVVPFTWRANGAARLFPQLEADLEIAAVGASRSQISLSGTYRPPLGLLGRALDRALLHRVAEATVKDFIDRVAERLSQQLPAAT